MWGTTTILSDSGEVVEVLNARRHYHKPADRPANYEKLFKFLKVYEDIKDYKGEGIKSAWFTLNKSNGPENLSVPNSYVANNLNRVWWDTNDGSMPSNLTLTTTLVISEKFDNIRTVTGINWSDTEQNIIQYISDNYDNFWHTKKIEQIGIGIINKGSVLDADLNIEVPDEDDLSPDDPWLSILARYALRSSGIPCEIKKVEAGIGFEMKNVYNTIVITLEIPYYSFSSSTPIVQSIINDLGEISSYENIKPSNYSEFGRFNGFLSTNAQITQKAAKQVTYYETEDDLDTETISRSYLQWESSVLQASTYNNLWVQKGDIWYLRADVISNPKVYGLHHTELNTYLFGLLDTGYKKKKAKWWQKLIAAVVFIVAVVLAFIYPPSVYVTSPVLAAASAVLVGALVVTLATMVLGAFGFHEWSSAFAWVSKEAAPLIMVASIIMVVDFYNTAVNKLSDMTVNEVITSVFDSVVDDLSMGISGVTTDIQSIVGVTTRITNAYTKVQMKKLESISSKNKDLKAEYEKLQEELSMDTDIMMGYMNIYAKPATADWSMYSSTFDLPYERGGGTLSIGNIQRTTKRAIRPADYNDPMFEGIMLV